MGFDLYGKNPTNPEGHQPPSFDWSRTDIDDSEKKAYFEALEEYQKKVKGDYFRANVWWWRPIWDFTCYECDDILSDKDRERGSFNDSHFINKAKSIRIAKRLYKAIESGKAKEYEDRIEKIMSKAKKKNAEIDAQLERIREKVVEQTGKSDIVPKDYPEKWYNEWTRVNDKKDWSASYPFSEEFLKEFADFSKESGGFYIG